MAVAKDLDAFFGLWDCRTRVVLLEGVVRIVTLISVVGLITIASLKIFDVHVDEPLEKVFVHLVQTKRAPRLQYTSRNLR